MIDVQAPLNPTKVSLDREQAEATGWPSRKVIMSSVECHARLDSFSTEAIDGDGISLKDRNNRSLRGLNGLLYPERIVKNWNDWFNFSQRLELSKRRHCWREYGNPWSCYTPDRCPPPWPGLLAGE